MSGVLRIEIKESAEELKALMDSQSKAVLRSKVQMLWWLKSGQALQVNQLAELSGYHRTTLSRWLSQYREGGLSDLLSEGLRTGRPSVLSPALRQQLSEELAEPEGFSSYREVQQWLAAVHGQYLPYTTVHKIVRYDLKAKLKRARPVSENQKSGAVEAFQQTWAS